MAGKKASKNKKSPTEAKTAEIVSSTGGANSIVDEEAIINAYEDLPVEVQERRFNMRELIRRNLTYAAMAKILSVSERTIHRDMAWFRELNAKFVTNFQLNEEIGDTIEFLKEVEQKAMDAFRIAMEETERVVPEVDEETKKITPVVKQVPDHGAARGHLVAAMTARKQRTDLLQKSGLLKVVPEAKDLGGVVDVSRLRGDELDKANADIEVRIREITARIARYEGDDPLKEFDHQWED